MKKTVKLIVALLMSAGAVVDVFADADGTDWSPEQQAVIDAAKNGPMGIESDFDAWAFGYASSSSTSTAVITSSRVQSN